MEALLHSWVEDEQLLRNVQHDIRCFVEFAKVNLECEISIVDDVKLPGRQCDTTGKLFLFDGRRTRLFLLPTAVEQFKVCMVGR